MRQAAISCMIVGAAVFCALPSARAARVGEHAPDFSVADANGKTQKLSEYAGKFVVLEWSNRGCPPILGGRGIIFRRHSRKRWRASR